MTDLYRAEVLQARQLALYGEVVLRPPLAFAAWCTLAAAFAAAVVLLLVFGQYTKRTRVAGITVPAAGVLKLAAPQAGIVVARRVGEGDRVRAGQVLFVLSPERLTEAAAGAGGAQSAIVEQLERRRASLEQDLARRDRLHEQHAEATAHRLGGLHTEAAQLQRELATQAAREASAADQLARYDELARQHFVSELATRQRRDELLEQTARRQALERSLLAARREIGVVAAELKQLPLREEQQRAEVQRELATLTQEIIAAQATRRVVVVAPRDGVVTAIVAEPGQAVGAEPLATLLPVSSPLEVHLFAPSRAVGFVEPGQAVRVRYAAYPYQKFGQHDGEVVQVARSALAPAELPAELALAGRPEPLYRITVRLAQPYVMAYGRPQPLGAGMQLEADVMQDRRRLVEWLFEPLIALGRKL